MRSGSLKLVACVGELPGGVTFGCCAPPATAISQLSEVFVQLLKLQLRVLPQR